MRRRERSCSSTTTAPPIPNKLACLVQVVSDLRSRGIPLDGVGHEMHNAINYPSTESMVKAIDTVAEKFPGIDQQITELDMSVYNAGDTTSNYGNNIPPSVLAEQGWLYEQYFDAFRRLRGKLSAVTFWGMADDDTWLDGFPVARTDYPLPFDMGLQAKPAYWGIVDPKAVAGLRAEVLGLRDGRRAGLHGTVTITATNGNVGPAYTTQINGFKLTQIFGPRCSPKITAPGSFPIALGDIATSGTASAAFNVSFGGCDPNSLFILSVPWSSAVYHTGTFETILDFKRGKGK